MNSEKFCLRWNDFERNISSAFKDIRDAKEFFDITIACEDEQLQAHKVILSACSPFFKTVLRRNQHQHPLLYLKGVSYRDMEAVLNFMYHGEVNVAQDDLNSFLQVAEDLRVKGLTQNDSSKAANDKKIVDVHKSASQNMSRKPSYSPSDHDIVLASKRVQTSLNAPASRSIVQPVARNEHFEEVVPVVKSEPGNSPHPTVQSLPVQSLVQQEQSMAMYDEGSEQMMSQYDDSYGVEYDGHYGGGGFDSSMMVQDSSSADSSKIQCEYCEKWIHKVTITRHIKHQHMQNSSVVCTYCNSQHKNEASLSNHLRIKHSLFKQ